MKITLKLIGITALAVLIALFAACSNPAGDSDSDPDTVATPTATPAGGAVASGSTVALETTTSGAEIWYTSGSGDPSKGGSGSAKYTAPIPINAPITIKAIAVKDGLKNSGILTVSYTIAIPTVATPTATPAGGEVVSGSTVALETTTSGAEIWFTTGSGDPSKGGSGSTKYTAPIPIDAPVTIKAIAVKDGMNNSAILTASYTIAAPLIAIDLSVVETGVDDEESGVWEYTYDGTIQHHLFTIHESVQITGELLSVNKPIRFNIASGKKVVWKAKITCDALPVGSDNLIFIDGGGTYEVAAGAQITFSVDNLPVIYIENGDILVSGGVIIAKGEDNKVINNVYGDITVSGGTITAEGDDSYTIYAAFGNVTVTGGEITAKGDYSWAIIVYNDKSEVTVTGGTIKALGNLSYSIFTFGAKITHTGGTIIPDPKTM